jgi:hypothetical protein
LPVILFCTVISNSNIFADLQLSNDAGDIRRKEFVSGDTNSQEKNEHSNDAGYQNPLPEARLLTENKAV